MRRSGGGKPLCIRDDQTAGVTVRADITFPHWPAAIITKARMGKEGGGKSRGSISREERRAL